MPLSFPPAVNGSVAVHGSTTHPLHSAELRPAAADTLEPKFTSAIRSVSV